MFSKITSSELSFVKWDTDSLSESGSIVWVDLVEVCEHTFLNISSGSTKGSGQVRDQVLSISLGENLLPQGSWLLVVGIWVRVNMSTDLSRDVLLGPGVLFILNWSSH